MKISYILPLRNAQATAAQCIRSLLKQEIKGEIIIIDDCSTDNTRNIIKFYEDKVSKVIYNEKRLGAASCRNIGNKLAKWGVIAVCDADIYYSDRCHAISEFFAKKENDVFSSAVDCRDANNKFITWRQDSYLWDFKSKCPISHPTVAYRRSFAMSNPYHEDSVDTDLFEFMLLDMHKAGAKFGGCQESTMLKIEGDTTRDMDASNKLKSDKYREYGIEI